MPADFLGTGWSFPVEFEAGSARTAQYEESIRQSIWIILGTSRGERVMRPQFGCGIHDYVFGTSSPQTIGLVASEVRQALVTWEPRIEVEEIRVRSAGRGEVLEILIEYRVRATNSRENLVYPFYLERRMP
jgi:phage baseplate assembly protein W